MLKYLFFFSLYIFFFAACSNPEKTAAPIDLREDENYLRETDTGEKVVVYQMMTRLFGNTTTANKIYGTIEENGVGRFNDISEEALQALKGLGASHIWYTGALEHATMTDYTRHGIVLDDADVVKGRAGSPYAIKDYYDVDPDLAEEVPRRMEEFEALLERTHRQGLRVIIDFVPNHVARQYVSDAKPESIADFGAGDDTAVAFHPQNDFYYIPEEAFVVPDSYDPLGDQHQGPKENGRFAEMPAKASGNDVFSPAPTVNDWFETIKLNYGIDYLDNRSTHFDPVPDTWEKMRHILTYWTEKGVDGFRCDMAEMVPVEFWNWVIPKIKEVNPDILFIAEIYNPDSYHAYIETGGFDFLYDKVQLYDTLKHIIQQRGSTHNLPPVWKSLRGINRHMLRFLENHDEQRIASADFAGEPTAALPAMLVSATLYTGPVMVYFGQEVGEPGRGREGFGGEDGRTTIFDYWGVPEHQKWVNGGAYDGGQLSRDQIQLRNFYKNLLRFTTENEAIVSGSLYDLQAANRESEGYTEKVYAYLRFTENQRLLILTNFDRDDAARFKLRIPENVLQKMSLSAPFTLTGVLGTSARLNYEEGLELELPALAAYIFEF